MSNVIVGKEVLDIYDKYDQDFGLLDERWASEKDRQKVTSEQCRILSEYIENLQVVKIEAYSAQMKEHALMRIGEIEKIMDHEVSEILRGRVLGM